jgi:hypothetical protein
LPTIVDQIIDRTDGIPLFIEELTKTVVESDILVEAHDRYATTGPVAPLAIPTTLHASLLARLDRLPAAREVAKIGAALGRSFSHELISTVAQMPRQQIDDARTARERRTDFPAGIPPDAGIYFQARANRGRCLRHPTAHSAPANSCTDCRNTGESIPEIVAAQPQVLAGIVPRRT